MSSSTFNKNPLLSFAGIDSFDPNGNNGVILLGASEEKEKEPSQPMMLLNNNIFAQEIEDNFSEISLDRDTKDVYMPPQDQGDIKIYSTGFLDQSSDIFQTPEDHDQIVDPKVSENLPLHNLFAQLPNAASTVFSTFSNLIKGNKDNPEGGSENSRDQTQLRDNVAPYEDSNQFNFSLMNPQSVDNPTNPTFYSPSEYSGFVSKKIVGDAKPNNNFRIGSGRKVYAHIPGLTSKSASISEMNFPAGHNTYCGQEQSSMMMVPTLSSTQNNNILPISTMPTPYYATQETGPDYSQSYLIPQFTGQNLEQDSFISESAQNSSMTQSMPTSVPTNQFVLTNNTDLTQSSTTNIQSDTKNDEFFQTFAAPMQISSSNMTPKPLLMNTDTNDFKQNDPVQQFVHLTTQDILLSSAINSSSTTVKCPSQTLSMPVFSEVSNIPQIQNSLVNSGTVQPDVAYFKPTVLDTTQSSNNQNFDFFNPNRYTTITTQIDDQKIEWSDDIIGVDCSFPKSQCLKVEKTESENNFISREQHHQEQPKTENTPSVNLLSYQKNLNYRQVYKHWFYRSFEKWFPYSMQDSLNIELSKNSTASRISTDNGKFEVVFDPDSKHPSRIPIYYGEESIMRHCSWFYYEAQTNQELELSDFIPFDEMTSELLEKEYEMAVKNKTKCFKLSIEHNRFVTMEYSDITYQAELGGAKFKVKRGIDDFVIDDGESRKVDHLILYIYNGEASDHIHANDKLRAKLTDLIQSDYPDEFDCGEIGMIEVLPLALPLRSPKIQEIIREKTRDNCDFLKTLFYCSPEIRKDINDDLARDILEMVEKFKKSHLKAHGIACGSVSLLAESFEALFCYHVVSELEFDVNVLITIDLPTILLMNNEYIDNTRHSSSMKILNYVNEQSNLHCLKSKKEHCSITNIKFEGGNGGSILMSKANLMDFAQKIFNVFYH